MKNEFRVQGDVVWISLKQKNGVLWTQISIEDFDKVNAHRGSWYAVKPLSSTCYVAGHGPKIKGQKRPWYLMHRIIAGTELNPGTKTMCVVDHINGDTLDNRRINLRESSRSENNHNRRPGPNRNSTTGHRGFYVCWKDGAWRVKAYRQVANQKRERWFGKHETKESALAMVDVLHKQGLETLLSDTTPFMVI